MQDGAPEQVLLFCYTGWEVIEMFLQYNALGTTGLQVSQAGFGCYRVDVAVEEHRQAMRAALLAGVNLIDTSANYTDGASEELVGAVLAEMTAAGQIAREGVVVVSKAGYLQGHNYRLSQQRKREGMPFLDLVLVGEGLEHCIHPEFLAVQVDGELGAVADAGARCLSLT